jgi:predicted aldo/keto reductase-like oxidoreductase
VVNLALENGFRKFDTAEADWWYDQQVVGRALKDFYTKNHLQDCSNLEISTKIPPWSLTSMSDIRDQAANSRRELLEFCGDFDFVDPNTEVQMIIPLPLDVYYIHAPRCWKGEWHVG